MDINKNAISKLEFNLGEISPNVEMTNLYIVIKNYT